MAYQAWSLQTYDVDVDDGEDKYGGGYGYDTGKKHGYGANGTMVSYSRRRWRNFVPIAFLVHFPVRILLYIQGQGDEKV